VSQVVRMRSSSDWKSSVQRAALGGTMLVLSSAFSCDEASAPPPSQVSDPVPVGQIDLGLQLVDGSEVETVNYSITLDDEPLRAGSVPVREDGTASVLEANLEATPGYRVDLAARRRFVDRCRAVANFTVKAGETTPVAVTFQCPAEPGEPAP
jgi:hypothetical protein